MCQILSPTKERSTSFWKAGWYRKSRRGPSCPAFIRLTKTTRDVTRAGRNRADVLHPLEECRLSAVTIQSTDRVRASRRGADGDALEACRGLHGGGGPYFARGRRLSTCWKPAHS